MQTNQKSTLHVISHEFPPYVGGSGIVTLSLLNGLEILKANYSYFLGSKNIKQSKENFDTNKGYYVPFFSNFWMAIWPIFILFYTLVKTKRIDKIIILNYSAFQSYSIVAPLINRDVSLVLHGGDIDYIFGSEEYKSFVKRALFSPKRLQKALQRINRVISVSHYFANYIKREYQFQTCPILNSVSSNIRYEIDTVGLNVVSVGRVELEKGFDTTFSILEDLWESGMKFTWKVVGDGAYLNDLKSRVGSSVHSSKVEFFGSLPHEEVKHILKSCQIFVLPSRRYNSETFGLVYAEAMAAGLVVFAPLRSGASDYIRDTFNGFLVDNEIELRDRLIPVLENFKDYHQLRLRAIDTVKKKLSVEKMARKYLKTLYGNN